MFNYYTASGYDAGFSYSEQRIERLAYPDKKPRIVLMGTPDFAADICEVLLDSLHYVDVVGIYSRPDAVSKRGSASIPSPVSQLARERKIPLFTPATLRDTDVQKQLRALKPDLIIVAAYGMILPTEILSIPQHGCINVHGSLLPRWRGAAPIERAILAGDPVTGVCIMQMEEGLDTGPYCAYKVIDIAYKTAQVLRKELAAAGAWMLVDLIPHLLTGNVVWTAQDENLVTYAPKIEKAELELSPDLSVCDFVRRTRASGESAPAKLEIAGKTARVTYAQPFLLFDSVQSDEQANKNREQDTAPFNGICQGTARLIKHKGNRRVVLGCADGLIELISVKPDGKKIMPASDWFNGMPKVSSGKQDLTWH